MPSGPRPRLQASPGLLRILPHSSRAQAQAYSTQGPSKGLMTLGLPVLAPFICLYLLLFVTWNSACGQGDSGGQAGHSSSCPALELRERLTEGPSGIPGRCALRGEDLRSQCGGEEKGGKEG